MIKNMILINSANFIRAEFDLTKETFFVGSNAGGKTTSTRALHFLYNSNPVKLGIPSDKISFKKHYFPHDNSYIIYVFEEFFILTYKRGDEIKRYFSKQSYDQERIFGANDSLKEHDDIIKYIKETSWHSPQTIEEYTDILYGKNKKYLDFSIARIKNYETFIEVLNLVFNVDKAIVDTISIKRAIQKALKRDDEIVTLDFEEYIKNLRSFEMNYYFFKTFDSQRKDIDEAIKRKNELLNIEEKTDTILKMIQYRYEKEQAKLEESSEDLKALDIENKKYISKKNGRNKITSKKIPKLKKESENLLVDIREIENLKEKYSLEDFEENSQIANKYEIINGELNSKNSQLVLLEKEQIDVIEAYDNQIKELKRKIETEIPHETKLNIKSLTQREEMTHDEDKKEIEEEFSKKMEDVKSNITSNEKDTETLKEDISKENDNFRDNKKELQDLLDNAIKKLNIDIDTHVKKQENLQKQMDTIAKESANINMQIENQQKKYQEKRESQAMSLWNHRKEIKIKIDIISNQITTKPGTFQEFLSKEVENWEKEVYPIIDKEILTMPTETLNPKVKDSREFFSIHINTSKLATIPTLQEAKDSIKSLKSELYAYRKIAHEKFEEEKVEYNQEVAKLDASIEENNSRIDNIKENIKQIEGKIKELKWQINEENNSLESKIEKLNSIKKANIEEIEGKLKVLQKEYKALKEKIKNLKNEELKAKKNLHEKFLYNVNVIKKNENAKEQGKIKNLKKEIEKIKNLKKEHDKNDIIANLQNEVAILKEKNKKCILAKAFLEDFEKAQDKIKELHQKKSKQNKLNTYIENLEKAIKNSLSQIENMQEKLKKEKTILDTSIQKYKDGINEYKTIDIEFPKEQLSTEQLLCELIKIYRNLNDQHKSSKADLKSLISKFSKLQTYPLVEVDLSIEQFDKTKSIKELSHILEALDELEDFKSNKYESQKKRSHRNFSHFLKDTLPQKLLNFGNLENEFLELVDKINKNLKLANFGVVKDIKLQTKQSTTHKDSIAKLFESLSSNISDSINLYSKKSLFYQDIPRSVKNIENIIEILGQIKKRGTQGTINLFDAIDLSISYTENENKVKNKTHIKNDSSSGGNILLKVAIAMSILNIYHKPDSKNTPFYLIIDEVSKLQRKNQGLLREYINSNGFKTLYITPDALYPNPEKAIYYIFKNIEFQGDSLKAVQMNKSD